MKRIVIAGLAAVCVMALTQQQASAWVNSRFGVGLNWDIQSGGNSLGWGAWRNGQPPGPEAWGGQGYGGAPMPYYQHHQHHGYTPAPAPTFAPPPVRTTAEPPYAGGYVSPFQFATYPRPVQYYYYPGTTYYYYDR
ncbi:MAG TPA: hypothetical protein VFE62_18430 [Gemmataceae bacterium]|nr:hypothetical protein [Gemmataceae bacterium]